MRVSNVTVRRRLFTALIIGTVIFTALILRLSLCPAMDWTRLGE